jgi:hypothetical protein
MTHPLDGTYNVTSTNSYKGDIEKRSDGKTVIKNSQTERYDDANCKWTSTFTVLSDTEVKMVSVADASKADVDFLLTAPDGSPTRDLVTYETVLKLSRKGDRIQMSGQIHYGNDVVFLTLRRTGA